ncbi:MAG TPA: two-component system response regulator [Elusimicrobia bacterium]|nr:MAG: two-component system response regulator [Elusimicrobia bacterium GWA2_66_18]OGR76910.1 MAG: two-component system response regulator [Elusimicrobia bacterium GWC2_65_9]HAZ08192.1 two-component system response regulator [Elusimicrobiota bacterium]
MKQHAVDILLVEDNAQDEELTLRVLRKHHVANDIQVARDGQEALDCLFGGGSAPRAEGAVLKPKLVILDLNLPKVDGKEVLRRIKSDPNTRDIPVVMLTSSREERDLVESYRLGVNSYVVKPVQFEDFSEAVRLLGLYWLLINQPPLP